MKKLALCLSLSLPIFLGAMEEKLTIDTRLENLDMLQKNSKKEHSSIVFIPAKLNLNLQGHYLATSIEKEDFSAQLSFNILDSFDESIDKKNTYYAFYEDNLIVEKDDTDNIVQEATQALTYYENKWTQGKTPNFTLNLAAYTLFTKIIDTYPQEINQPSLAMALKSYKTWEQYGGKIRHKIPFAYEIFEQRGKNKNS